MSDTYVATLTAREQTVLRVSSLLHTERRRRGTRAGTRALSCHDHAVLVIRWLLDGTRVTQLAADNQIGRTTCYDNLHEALDVLAAQAPALHSALLAAKAAGYDYVIIDGTLVEPDRCRTPGPTPGVDLWWSGKHEQHGGNVQVITAPDGWPLWTSRCDPAANTTPPPCVNTSRFCLSCGPGPTNTGECLATWATKARPAPSRWATRNPHAGKLTSIEKTYNKVHNGLRAVGERGNSLLKTTFKALRNVSLCPWKIGTIVAAALVLLHLEHDRTT